MHRSRAFLAVSVLAFASASASGCGGVVSDPNGSHANGVGGQPADSVPPSGSADASPPPPSVDAGDPPIAIDGGGGAPVPKSIAEACVPGTPSRPEAFVEFEYVREHAPGCGGSSACATSLFFTADCRLHGVHLRGTYDFPLSPADCLALKTWTTSALLVDGIRDASICPGSAATWNPDQISTQMTDGTVNRKLDPMCDAAPFGANRACLNAVLNAYVPGPSFYP